MGLDDPKTDSGFAFVEKNGRYLIIGTDRDGRPEDESGRIWLSRDELTEMVDEIRSSSPEIEPREAERLIIATLVDQRRKPDGIIRSSKEATRPKRDYNEIYVVMVAKRAKQFELFAQTYAKHALLKAKGLGTPEAVGYAMDAEEAWRNAKSAAAKAALAAVAAVKSGEVAEAVQVAAIQAEEALRRSADCAQTALDAANRIVQGMDRAMVTPLDANVEPFLEKIRICVENSSKSADRAELFAGYARTYVQMAALKTISLTGADVDRQALHFSGIAATAAAQAMMAADEARVCAQKVGFPKFFTVAEKQKIDAMLDEADQKAKTALATAVEAAANTGMEVLRK